MGHAVAMGDQVHGCGGWVMPWGLCGFWLIWDCWICVMGLCLCLCCGFGFGSCCGVAGFLTDVGLLGLCLCLWWWCHHECLKTMKNR